MKYKKKYQKRNGSPVRKFKKKPKVLLLGDLEGWAIDNKVKNILNNVKGFWYTLRYWTSTTEDEFAQLVKDHDLVYFGNWDIYKYVEIIKRLTIPSIMCVGSFRYPPNVVELAGLVDGVVIHTKELKEYFPKAVVIHNAIGPQFYPRKPFVVGFAGRPDEYKGFPMIKQACKELGVEFKPCTGEVSYKNMPSYYDSIDLLVVASINEGFCAPVIEALSMNVPVISTDVGIAREFDFVYKIERSVEGIKRGILRHYTSAYILEHFSKENISKQYKALFEKLLQKGKRKRG